MDTDADPLKRVYFDVYGEGGQPLPAVQYWAACIDEDQPAFEVMPVRKFVKLLGRMEPLQELDEGVYKGLRSGRIYRRQSPAVMAQ